MTIDPLEIGCQFVPTFSKSFWVLLDKLGG